MKIRLTYRILTVLFISFCYCVLPTADKARAGAITGTVVDDDGGAFIGNVRVAVYAAGDDTAILADDYTDAATGAYSVTAPDVPDCTGDCYKVRFVTDDTDYIEEWHNDSPDFDGAVPVALGDLGKTGLAKGGKISGTVTYSGTAPTESVYVQAYNAASGAWVKTAQVDSSTREYALKGLPSGDYHLFFWAYLTGYISEWYNNVLYRTSATSVTVAQVELPVSVEDAELDFGTEISGTVTDSEGNPVEDALVLVYDSLDSEELRGFAYTSVTGIYTVKGLPSGGSVKVQFCEREETDGSCGGLTEWYDNKRSFDSATEVNTGDSGIDAVLGDVLDSDFNWLLVIPELSHRHAAP